MGGQNEFLGEQGVTSIDTGAIREAASTLDRKLSAIGKEIGVLTSAHGQIPNYWMGSAEREYLTRYERMVTNLVNSFRPYVEMPKELIAYAEEYEEAHGLAVSIAAAIEPATWAEV